VVDLFDATPSRAYLLTVVTFSKTVENSGSLIPAENKRKPLRLQTELPEKKTQSLHSEKLTRRAQQIFVTIGKGRYS